MASAEEQASEFSDKIITIIRRHLDDRKRSVQITVEKNFDGEEITQIAIFVDPDETHDISALTSVRHDFAMLTSKRKDLANAQLSFRVNMSAALKGHGNLGEDIELTKIHKMIESLSP